MSMEKRIKYIDPPTREEETASMVSTLRTNGLVLWLPLAAEVWLRNPTTYSYLMGVCTGWLILNSILVVGSLAVRWNPQRRSVRVRTWEFMLYIGTIGVVFTVLVDAGWWYLAGVIAHYIPLVMLELRTLNLMKDMEKNVRKDIG